MKFGVFVRKAQISFIGGLILSISFLSCTSKSRNEPPNTLHLVTDEKIKGLDPIYASDLYSGIQTSQAYETLLEYHYLKRPYTLTPSLAETMPEVSKDGLTYTFHLRKGILFQDDPAFKETHGKGRELIADDVVYSFKRLADPKLVSTGWWIFDGKLVGLNAWRDTAANSGVTNYSLLVEGMKSLGRYTVQFKLVRPSPQFLYFLAMPLTGIVSREAVEAYGREFINHAVGTGPFRLAEYNPNSKIVWVRNPTYRKNVYPAEGEPGDKEAGLLADANKQLPLSDQMIIHVFVERQPMWLTFLSGKLDLSAIPKDNFSSAISGGELNPELSAKGIKLTKSPSSDVTHLTFNMDDPIVGTNKYLRQALSLAYDEKSFIELFYNGRAIPAQGPIPPGMPGYDPEFKNPFRQYDLPKAKELLAKAGFPGGKGLQPLEYASLADSAGRQGAEFLQKMMAGIGVKLKINSYSWPQFLEVVKNKRAQIWQEGWSADYPDPENFLQLFYGKNASPGPNDSNYSNPEYDRLYEKLISLKDKSQALELYRKMVNIVVEDCPWIFGSHRIGFSLTQPWLKNYKPNDFDHSRYKYYRVDVGLKK